MKLIPAVLCLFLFSGCALIPKNVEFFQKKVKPVPVISESGQERQRQAADYIARSEPTNHVAGALSTSLGPPYKPYTGNPEKLAQSMRRDVANLNDDIRDYSETVSKEAGKKIEGTGLIQMSYFKFAGLVIGFFMLLWFGLRVYGLFNPLVGTATGIVGRVSSSVLNRGFSEVVAGGQQFLSWVDNSNLAQETKDWITNTFKVAQQTQQSADVQKTVDKLVASPINSTVPVQVPRS